MQLAIDEDDDGRRIDAVVRRRLGLPRSLVMKLLRTGKVRLNGARVKPDAHVASGDSIDVADPGLASHPMPHCPSTLTETAHEGKSGRKPAPGAAREAATRAPRPPRDLARRIVHEDADVLVFDKPPGLVAHVGTGHGGGLVDLLHAHLGVAPDAAFRPALANRLDRDTSGLVLLAKTALALRRLNATIRAGGLEKGYLALVRGAPEPPEGEVRAALRKDRGPDGLERMTVVPDGAPGALPAATGYRVLRRIAGGVAAASEAGLALVELSPRTGRTHQLRAHLAHLGCPIAGDPRYGDREWNRALEREAGLRRLFLHASRLAFPHPRTGARIAVEAPLAADLAAALDRLEKP
ncbi:MAG TPA: RluA family pseudouridine synthase [Planctomycetota bacterium]|nr:RluA family pseudouridine synthase [Planctomycetota bacterium]